MQTQRDPAGATIRPPVRSQLPQSAQLNNRRKSVRRCSAVKPFEERVQETYRALRKEPGPYKPISRRRLARMLGCSEQRIKAIEDRFRQKLHYEFGALNCFTSTAVNYDA